MQAGAGARAITSSLMQTLNCDCFSIFCRKNVDLINRICFDMLYKYKESV